MLEMHCRMLSDGLCIAECEEAAWMWSKHEQVCFLLQAQNRKVRRFGIDSQTAA